MFKVMVLVIMDSFIFTIKELYNFIQIMVIILILVMIKLIINLN